MMKRENAPPKILILDDEKELQTALCTFLQKQGYSCVTASNGLEGLEILKTNQFSLVLTDVRMPEMNGIELLKNVKALNIPVIVITGFANDLDLKSATALGAVDFLTKPFKLDDLLSSVEIALHQSKEGFDDELQNLDTEYCRVHIDDFLSGTKLSHDLFLRLSQTKYLRVAKADAPLLSERVTSYKNKGLQFFYIRKEEFASYVGFNLKIAQRLNTGQVKIKKSDKLKLIRQATDIYMENVFVNGIDRDNYNYGKSLAESALQMTVEADSLYELIDILRNQSDASYGHSLAVSIYSALVAKASGWTSASTLFKVSMAGLLHDIGKKEIPRSILMKNRISMTAEEVQIYETHPKRARDLLFQVPSTPEEVVLSTYQHHERMNGTGYPTGIIRSKIHPFARIVGLVDEFCHLVLKGPMGDGLDPAEAIGHIYPSREMEFDGFFVRGLFQILNLPIPERLKNITIVNDVREGD